MFCRTPSFLASCACVKPALSQAPARRFPTLFDCISFQKSVSSTGRLSDWSDVSILTSNFFLIQSMSSSTSLNLALIWTVINDLNKSVIVSLCEARHHKWAGGISLCKWQVNITSGKNLKPHDPAHLSVWRSSLSTLCCL